MLPMPLPPPLDMSVIPKISTDQVEPWINELERRCRERGLRLTPSRRTVLRTLYLRGRPVSAYTLLRDLGDLGWHPAPPTVYRALDFGVTQGFAHRVETLQAFIACPQPGPIHRSQFLICTGCGDTREVMDRALATGVDAAAAGQGFTLERSIVEMLGRCSTCTANESEGPSSG